MRRYGTPHTMSYDLHSVTAPVYIFWSPNDDYATEPVRQMIPYKSVSRIKSSFVLCGFKDIKWLAERLGNLKECIMVSDPTYGHFDFITADNVNSVINYPVMKLMPPSNA